jgi:hypothetical protein
MLLLQGLVPALLQLTVAPEIGVLVALSVTVPLTVVFPSVNVFCACDTEPAAIK